MNSITKSINEIIKIIAAKLLVKMELALGWLQLHRKFQTSKSNSQNFFSHIPQILCNLGREERLRCVNQEEKYEMLLMKREEAAI